MCKYAEKRRKHLRVMAGDMGKSFGKMFLKLMLKPVLLVDLLGLEKHQLVELFQRP